ncbi:unnamed protein product [Sphagnum balticum]
MLKTNFANYPKGPETCNNLNDLLGRGIFSVDGELWKLQRKVAIHEFTTRSLRSFMQQIVQVELDTRLIPLLSHTCSAGVVVDLQDLLCRFTFDTICKLALGVDPECLHISLPAVEFAHAFDTATKISSSRFHTYPFIWRTLRALNVGSERKLREAIHQIDEFAMSVIRKRKQQMQQQMDLLSRLLLLSFDESKRSSSDVVTNDSATPPESRPETIFSDVFLRDIVISFVLAGRDTSSSVSQLQITSYFMGIMFLAANTDQNLGDRSALCWSTAAGISWFFWLLSRNRHVEDSIRAEIAEIVRSRNHHHRDHHVANNKKDTMSDTTTHTTTAAAADGELQKGNSTTIADWEKDEPAAAAAAANPNIDMITSSKFTYEELKKMHYLDAAMTESMRLYPPVPFDSKLAMEEDTWPDGTHIPKDSVVAYAPYAMGRMEQLWGSDCLEFKPERWLDDNGVFQPQSPYKYAVFQAGQRVCLGKELAMLQMKLLVATLVSHFTISMSSSISATSEAAADAQDAQDAQDDDDDGGDDDDDFKPTYEISLTLPIKNGLPVRIHLATQDDEDIKAKASKA